MKGHKKMNAIIKKAIVLTVLTVMCRPQCPVEAALIAHWKLDETSGVQASDSSGNGHHAVLSSQLSFDSSSVPGVIDKALHLADGTGWMTAQTVSIPTDAFTVALWFKSESDLNKGSARMYMIFWNGPETILGDKPYLVFNKFEEAKISFYVTIGQMQYWIQTTTTSWKADKWYHIAATFDGTSMKLFVNGIQEAVAIHSGKHYPSQGLCIGARNDGDLFFVGMLDDFRIYDRALSQPEIAALKWSDPMVQEFADNVRKARVLIEKQQPKKAVTFLEENIKTAEKWLSDNPDKGEMADTVMAQLYLELAKAMDAAGGDTKIVIDMYKKALRSRGMELTSCVTGMLVLQDKMDAKQYSDTIKSITLADINILSQAVPKADIMMQKQRPDGAVAFLEASLTAYQDWQKQYPYDDQIEKSYLPFIYFKLAKAREAAGQAKKQIAGAYCMTFEPADIYFVAVRKEALKWLLANRQTEQYTPVLRALSADSNPNIQTLATIAAVCQDAELQKDWDVFETLLDGLFTQAKEPVFWVDFVRSTLTDPENRWARAFNDYLNRNPRVKLYDDQARAQKCEDQNRFSDAVEIYRDIVSRCQNEEDRRRFELRLVKSIFNDGKYAQAITAIDEYIEKNNTADKEMLKQAQLLKGQSYVQLKQLDKALDIYLSLMVENPKAKDLAEVNFFMGYCYMLQKKLDDAKSAFECVIKDSSESPYANKARLCMIRIRNISRAD
jgi:tetratricopeptide (TPR) repeat protein